MLSLSHHVAATTSVLAVVNDVYLHILQYGFIYNTLRNLVVENYGEKTWIEIW